LKIIHVIPSLQPKCGGPSRAVSQLIQSQIRDGMDVTVITHDASGGLQPCTWRQVPSYRLFSTKSGEIPDADIYHVNAIWNPFSSLAMRSLRRAGKPYVLSLRGMLRPETIGSFKKRVWARLLERANLAGASLVHVTSEDELEAAQACGWQMPAAALIPNPVEPPDEPHAYYATDAVEMNGHRSILYVGRLSRIKRLDLLLRSFALVRKKASDLTLILAGPDSERIQPELERLTHQLSIYRSVVFTGMQNRAELNNLFRHAHVVALVSQRENFGVAAAEAMAHGVPTVLTRHVGIAREAEKAGGAVVVEDYPEAVAEGLLGLIHDFDRARTMSISAQNFVQSQYSPSRVAEMFVCVYKWILRQGPKPDCVRLN
jgi:glycosyltransferase involved in cell wall biosynthesis